MMTAWWAWLAYWCMGTGFTLGFLRGRRLQRARNAERRHW